MTPKNSRGAAAEKSTVSSNPSTRLAARDRGRRRASIDGSVKRPASGKKEPLKPVLVRDALSAHDWDKLDSERRSQGKLLAEAIYQLTNVERVRELERYLQVINDAVLSKNSEENQAILETAVDYFRETYGPEILSRGESPELIDQIVHRTGKQTRSIVNRTLRGFDAAELAENIWKAGLSRDSEKLAIAIEVTFRLTNDQIRELRSEYSTIPAKHAAIEFHSALTACDTQKQHKANCAAIHYLLRGKTKIEAQQIEFQYDGQFHIQKGTEVGLSLRQAIQTYIPEEESGFILELLDGFDAESYARQIEKIMSNPGAIIDLVRSDLPLHHDLIGSFRRDYTSAPNWERELRTHEALDDLITGLTADQFRQIQAALSRTANISLTPNLYRCNEPFDSRRIAIALERSLLNVDPAPVFERDQEYLSAEELDQVKQEFRLSNDREIWEIIRARATEIRACECLRRMTQALTPLAYLSTQALTDVKDEFELSSGQKLEEAVFEQAKVICGGDLPLYVTELIKNRLSGVSRLPLKADLFDLFPSSEKRARETQMLARIVKNEQKAAQFLDKIEVHLKNAQAVETNSSAKLFRLTVGLPREVLHEAEKLFFRGGRGSLQKYLKSKLTPQDALRMELIFAGIPAGFFTASAQKRLTIENYFNYPVESVSLLLESAGDGSLAGASDVVKKLFLAIPRAKRLFELLAFAKNLPSEDALEMERILSSEDILFVESAFNMHFARFRFCFDRLYGSLFERLRFLTSQNLVPRTHFARSAMLLERLPAKLIEDLSKFLENAAASADKLQKVHDLFRTHKSDLKLINRSFNVFNTEHTLRDSIHNLELPLEKTNKTLLLLDGFDPDAVAAELQRACLEHAGEELANLTCEILRDPRGKPKNLRLPQQMNWIDEMYHQIRVSFFHQTGNRLLALLKQKGIPTKGKGLNLVAVKLYGEEAAKAAVDLHRLLLLAESNKNADRRELEERVVALFSGSILPIRERIIDMYEAYFGPSLSGESLAQRLQAVIQQPSLISKIMDSLSECNQSIVISRKA